LSNIEAYAISMRMCYCVGMSINLAEIIDNQHSGRLSPNKHIDTSHSLESRFAGVNRTFSALLVHPFCAIA